MILDCGIVKENTMKKWCRTFLRKANPFSREKRVRRNIARINYMFARARNEQEKIALAKTVLTKNKFLSQFHAEVVCKEISYHVRSCNEIKTLIEKILALYQGVKA